MNQTSHTVLLGQGKVAELIRSADWSESPLGPPDTWPQSLLTVVSLMLNSKFPMFTAWGPELGFIYNDAYIDVLGQKHPSALGRRFVDIWSEIWSDISPIIDKAMAGEPSYFENLPLTMMRKGYLEQTWFTFSYSPVCDETGAVAGMYCACTETTQHVLAERQRIDENERLKDLFKQAPGIMAVMRHANHTYELANEAYYQLVGGRELIGKPVRVALPELEGQGLFELLDQVYASGEPHVGRATSVKLLRQQDGQLEERFVDFIFQPIRDLSGNVSGIFIEGSDVTDSVKAVQALRENEQRLRQLANTIPHLAWMANPDGWIHWYNDRWYEYTGTTLEQMQGWGWQSVHDPEVLPTVVKSFKESLRTGTPFEMAFPLRSATGEYRTFFTRVAPLRDSDGTIVHWFGTNTDIHEIEKVQEELRAANRRKDEFLAMLAHELRNPLAPISTAAELLKLANLDPVQINETSAVIRRQVAHMTDLVDDLLDVSRVTRGLVTLQESPVDVNEVIVDAVEQVTHIVNSKNQRWFANVAVEPAFVMGDRTRLIQIFSNILNNATRYTPDGGEIALRVVAHEQQVEVSVADKGAGIDAELLPHIFDLFTQAERSPDRAQGGLGLGLALVKSLVDLHNGHVTAHSEGSNLGAEFVVSLPRIDTPALPQASEQQVSRPTPEVQAQRILIVDDNVDAARTLCTLLCSYGYDAFVEHTAHEALARVPKDKPQIIILDIGLPDMDGFKLAQLINALPEAADSLLIALTGYGQSRDREQSKAAGFAHHFVKPVAIQKLLDLLSDASL